MITRLADKDSIILFNPCTMRYSILSNCATASEMEVASEALLNAGRSVSELNPYALSQPTVKTLNVANTMSCNMTCDYCYCGQLPLPSATMPASDKQLKNIERFLSRQANGEANLVFIGGEPLAGASSLETCIRLSERIAEECNVALTIAIYTNGLALTREKIAWINKHRIRVIISMDGPPEQHDKRRHLRSGMPSAAKIMPNIKAFMNDYWSPIRTVRCVTPTDGDYYLMPKYLLSLGFNDIGIQPTYSDEGVSDPMTAEMHVGLLRWYARQLCSGDVFGLEPYTSLLLRLAKRGRAVASHYPCDAGAGMLGLSDSGNLTPCHHFFGDDRFDLSKEEGAIASRGATAYRSVDERTPCRSCFARYLCGGACYHRAYRATGDYFGSLASECERRRALVAPAIHEFDILMRKRPSSLFKLARGEYSTRLPDRHNWDIHSLSELRDYDDGM